eukprot:3767226-Rhodomonas_salina.1
MNGRGSALGIGSLPPPAFVACANTGGGIQPCTGDFDRCSASATQPLSLTEASSPQQREGDAS